MVNEEEHEADKPVIIPPTTVPVILPANPVPPKVIFPPQPAGTLFCSTVPRSLPH